MSARGAELAEGHDLVQLTVKPLRGRQRDEELRAVGVWPTEPGAICGTRTGVSTLLLASVFWAGSLEPLAAHLFAMDTTPAPECFSAGWISSLNFALGKQGRQL